MANGIGPWTHRCWWQFVDRVARCHTDQMENWLRTAWSSFPERERERERERDDSRRWYSTGVSCWSLHGIAQLVHGSGRLEILQPARVSVVRVCVIVLCTQPHAVAKQCAGLSAHIGRYRHSGKAKLFFFVFLLRCYVSWRITNKELDFSKHLQTSQ